MSCTPCACSVIPKTLHSSWWITNHRAISATDFSSEAPAAAMDDFERRRELRRQKREEMRQEVERATYQRTDDDEEEAAREKRRRAREERQKLNRDDGDGYGGTQNSITGEETKSSSVTNADMSVDDEAALLERLAKREERRQKRLKEAMERQKELDPTISITTNETISDKKSSRNGENEVQENDTSPKENNTDAHRGQHEVEEAEAVDKPFEKNDRKEEEVEHVETEEVEVKNDEEEEEEAPEEPHIEENQVEVTFQIKNVEMSRAETDGEVRIEAVITREDQEQKVEEETLEQESVEAEKRERQEEEARREAVERERVEAERKEAEERERLEEEARREAAERERVEAERKAAEERERLEAEQIERQRRQEEDERRAEEERQKAEQKRAEEERKRLEAEEKRKAEEQRKAEEKKAAEERERKKAEEKKAAEEKARLEAKKKEEKVKAEEKKADDKQVKGKKLEDKMQPAFLRKQGEDKENKFETKKDDKGRPGFKKEEVKDDKPKGGKEELKSSWERKSKTQNGESLHEVTPQKLKHMDKFGGAKGSSDVTDAGKKFEELKHRRGEPESVDNEKLKQKQQEAAAELEELKKKREQRRKLAEEEEQRKKQEEAEKKAKEEEEKKKLKEEIERRRAEAAEKRHKLPDEGVSDEKKPFKCLTPKASAFKIEERAEFLNRSSQKSVKASQPAVVSKIDSRLEQYTSALGSNKGPKSAKPAPADLPLVTEGVRNIKSMWEKGNVFSSPSGVVSPNKETAGLKVGVSSRINEWLTKTPETNKTPSAKPLDLRPGDVSGKRNIWEKQQTEKPGSPTKMTTGGKKSDTNGLRFEKEP
ncbi:caldesmon isoform X2 [Engystomops pustulosus]|uniref:caldesmon isoform X2 n=1 Tax=Engystomops pustulosus TaxID=76066 RepID=UPI003AFA7067